MPVPPAPEQKAAQVDSWAIVELFGHARIAGKISEQTIAGDSLLRVDVPEVPAATNRYGQSYEAIPAHTRYVGGKAIYSLNPVDEVAARVAAASIRHKPVETYSLAAAGTTRRRSTRPRRGLRVPSQMSTLITVTCAGGCGATDKVPAFEDRGEKDPAKRIKPVQAHPHICLACWRIGWRCEAPALQDAPWNVYQLPGHPQKLA